MTVTIDSVVDLHIGTLLLFISQGAAHTGVVAIVTVDIHGDLVCGGGSDGSCTVWSLRTCREKARLTGHQQKVWMKPPSIRESLVLYKRNCRSANRQRRFFVGRCLWVFQAQNKNHGRITVTPLKDKPWAHTQRRIMRTPNNNGKCGLPHPVLAVFPAKDAYYYYAVFGVAHGGLLRLPQTRMLVSRVFAISRAQCSRFDP